MTTPVSKTEFFKAVGPLNVHPFIVGQWPYTSEFRTPDGIVVGRIRDNERGESEYELKAGRS